MKVLAFDPGATRMGFACIEGSTEGEENKPPKFKGSGYFGVERGRNGSKPEPYQAYRLRLIDFWLERAPGLIAAYKPNVVVNEIVPVVGGGNFVVATQSQLASTAITVVQVVTRQLKLQVEQIGATTVKARIGGGKKATKVAVRNGVFKLMPEVRHRKKEWVKIFDESDAYAIGLTYLGYSN